MDIETRPATTDEFLTLHEVAAWTKVSPETLRHWRKRGTGGPPSFRLGRRVMYRRAAVLGWIEAQEVATTGQGAA